MIEELDMVIMVKEKGKVLGGELVIEGFRRLMKVMKMIG